MPRRCTIQVFEHGALKVGERGFCERHFAALCRLADASPVQYFKVGHRKLVFQQYVGVIQVGEICIEVLPKADKADNNHAKWRSALLKMLVVTKRLPLLSPGQADLGSKNGTLFEIFINQFLLGVEQLVAQGLQRKYVQKTGPLKYFKGKVEFGRQISRNAGDQTRVLAKYSSYDLNHPLHRVILSALKSVPKICGNPELVGRSKSLVYLVGSVSQATMGDLERAKKLSGKNVARYKTVLSYAEQILTATAQIPESGSIPTIAIMFDMNRLFEQYVLTCMKTASRDTSFHVRGQVKRKFYENRTIKPDIMVTHCGVNYILDTKWKILSLPEPSDADLKQMYSYNNYFDCPHSILLYPCNGKLDRNTGRFHRVLGREEGSIPHYCTVDFVSLFDRTGSILPAKATGLQLLRNLESLVAYTSGSKLIA